ncbi:hypothetical protein T265_12405 [Opisthorchis viverrini]|nr:hypothetical protein T265_12405 [Opisthorchis viverrini]KER17996.1 hypothetical protein T265_12405 [Opisthorchis viverrini]
MSGRSAATCLGLRRLFAILDTNGDGKIDLQELTDGLRIFGFKPAGIQVDVANFVLLNTPKSVK